MIRFRPTPRLLALTLCALLAGCSQEQAIHKFATPQAERYAEQFMGELVRRDTAAMLRRLSPELGQQPHIADSLVSITRMFPPGRPESLEIIGAQVRSVPGGTFRLLSYEARFSTGWALVQVTVREDEQKKRSIEGVYIEPMKASLKDANRFTLAHKGLAHWVVFALAIALPLFCLVAMVQVYRTPMRRRWAWMLLAALGGGKLVFNWATGEFAFALINVQLLAAGSTKAGVGAPWMISLAFPIGAWMALDKRRRVLRAQRDARSAAAEAAAADPPPPADDPPAA